MVEIGISLYWISASWLFIYRLFSVAPMDFLICNRIFPVQFLTGKGLINRLFGKGKVSGINFLGKHSLIIYMIHQPICYVVAFLVSEIF